MARPRQVSDDEILEVARECFLTHGPGVSTTVIAEQLGVSQAALFKRFHTKQDLLIAALSPPAEPAWLPLVHPGPDDRPLRDQLLEIASAMHRFFLGMTPCIATLQASGLDMRALMSRYDVPPPIRAQRALTAWFARAVDRGIAHTADPAAVASMLIGALHGRHFMAQVGGATGDDEAYVDAVVTTLCDGLEVTP
ncbi:MAG: TetR/AcrR family transcriptional regulator [Alphaproteobacteria bacterium]|nr:TetR/AcrR family transcriptional regulator [Alphaproteobacteria bacterium]